MGLLINLRNWFLSSTLDINKLSPQQAASWIEKNAKYNEYLDNCICRAWRLTRYLRARGYEADGVKMRLKDPADDNPKYGTGFHMAVSWKKEATHDEPSMRGIELLPPDSQKWEFETDPKTGLYSKAGFII